MYAIESPVSDCFEVRFASLFRPGRAVSFPCDETGFVDIEALPVQARQNYLSAIRLVGSEYATPQVCAAVTATRGLSRH